MRNEQDRALWAALLGADFSLTLPVTHYRSCHHRNEVRGGIRVLRGVDAVMADTASLAVMIQSFGQGNTEWREAVKR